MTRRIILAAASLSALSSLWALSNAASAHALLASATPAVGSTVAAAPAEVTILFTQEVEPLFSTITVQNAAGADITTGGAHTAGDATRLAVALKPLPPGTYKVTWHALSVDTHKTTGSFSFTVAP